MDTSETRTEQVREDPHFLGLIQNLHATTFIHLGKIKDPSSDEATVNLEAAKISIDMLRMLANKTKGNLAETEKRVLDHVLFEVQMNFVDEMEKSNKSEKTEQTEQTAETVTTSEETDPEDTDEKSDAS